VPQRGTFVLWRAGGWSEPWERVRTPRTRKVSKAFQGNGRLPFVVAAREAFAASEPAGTYLRSRLLRKSPSSPQMGGGRGARR
jgi:hypothetical protein